MSAKTMVSTMANYVRRLEVIASEMQITSRLPIALAPDDNA
ncbi:hypothetical protein FHX49_002521 [Microbacterium endophyticum]|uniref:Uncharacterized protein n=1 Tax=Microbacterium endophyticum TaxID=1526412 RepID=A0A7W4V4X7_9MICO|nr:hypothetical protein [Microbacterium endophyticum]MBB2976933.1 hypothetical protein [Microbacterium endophyticum]NIK35749.1 hypothetical protein [Microbacterium endophyticum]